MKRASMPTSIMNLFAALVLLAASGPLWAADKSKAAADPLAGAFFPPEMVMLAGDQIGFTAQQREAFHARMEKAQARSEELRALMERATADLSALAKQDHVDEAALGTQLDKVLDIEREAKHLHIGLLAALKNLLTPDQQAQLRKIAQDGGAGLMAATRQRLTAKVERVKQGAQQWAASGRDPSPIAKTMEQKVKPLLDGGKVLEAEAELDRLLEELKAETK